MQEAGTDGGMPEGWEALCDAGDWRLLRSHLGDHALLELAGALEGCESTTARRRILREVSAAASEFGDRALMVGLARAADPEGQG